MPLEIYKRKSAPPIFTHMRRSASFEIFRSSVHIILSDRVISPKSSTAPRRIPAEGDFKDRTNVSCPFPRNSATTPLIEEEPMSKPVRYLYAIPGSENSTETLSNTNHIACNYVFR